MIREQMNQRELEHRCLELFLLLFLAPISLLFINFDTSGRIALSVFIFLFLLVGLIFVIWTWKKEKPISFLKTFKKDVLTYGENWRYLLLRLIIGMLLTGVFMFFYLGDELFSTILNHTDKWLLVSVVYLFVSVYPQEFIYRSFFIHRYQRLFKNQVTLFLVNATLFSLAHLFFRSILVLLLTFLGGLFFMYTYKQSKSIHITSIEHAFYGSWLFALGLGKELGFPF